MQRHLRLRRSADFKKLREHGQRRQRNGLLMSSLPNGLPHNRYGFVVSRKIGKAVRRNRLRRQLREAMRSLNHQLQQGYDIVIVVRRYNEGTDLRALVDTLQHLARQLSITR